jgi:hypothetical protein
MVNKFTSHIRSNVVGYLALFVALGGTAVAAIAPNSVGTPQLKDGAVTGPKIAKETITGANIAPKTITGSKIKVSTLGTVPNASAVGGQPASTFEPSASAITHVAAGTDLTGGGTSGTVTLGADETKLQHRVSGTCATGSAISSIAQAGTVGCQTTSIAQMMGASVGSINTGSASSHPSARAPRPAPRAASRKAHRHCRPRRATCR